MGAIPKFQVKNYYFTEKSSKNYTKSAQEKPLRSIIQKKSNILNFEDKILISNIISISKSINNLLLPIFKNWFIFCSEIHNYDTVSSSTDKWFKSSYRTDSYGKNSIIVSAINCWNETQNMLGGQSLKSLFIQPKSKTCLHKDASTNPNFVKILVENYIRVNTT